MKKFIILITAAIFLAACSDSSTPTPTTPQTVSQTVKSGDWIITYFFDDKDETQHFNGYSFTFNDDGSLVASNGTLTYNGTWSTKLDDDDSHTELVIYFATASEFEELNDDWDVLSESDNRIELVDTSGGNGGIDNLIFERL